MTMIRTLDGRTIITQHDPPPIPVRAFDWTAIEDDTYDGPGCPIGSGPTEGDAVLDLLTQLEERAQ